jgi:rare lipoprotein A
MLRKSLTYSAAVLLLLAGCTAPLSLPPLPSKDTTEPLERGIASFYSLEFKGRPTASGETYNPAERTAAHKFLPFGSRLKVRNISNGKTTIVRVNDRGPFIDGRIIDLSTQAALDLEIHDVGTAAVELWLIVPSG